MPTAKIPPLEQQVLAYIRARKLAASGQTLVVAVSGGPDSVCLLHILAALREELGITLHIAHLNHQLRGKDSVADAAYVAGLAKRLDIPATIASRDVRAYRAQHRLTLEEAAREVRYAFLGEVAANIGAAGIAVGHTADDHIETILMHLLRGSGGRGLRGLLPVSRRQVSGYNLTVIRPLLELSRPDTVAYCRKHRLQPRADKSNFLTQPFRNRVRHKLLPELRKYNLRIREALLRLARATAEDMDFIEGEARRHWIQVVTAMPDSVVMDKKALLALPPALQRQLLRSAIEALLGNLKDIEAVHIENIIAGLHKPAGKVIGLPFGLSFTVEYDRYVLAADAAALCPFPPLEGEITLKVPGRTSFSGWDITADVIPPQEAEVSGNDDFTACLDFARVGSPLTVRRRLPGDRFQPLGLAQPKKLNVFMIDARIPRSWRRRVPVVCGGGRMLWVVGCRIDERARVRPDTEKVLRLEFRRA
ncbi:MAG: tRNA lysidine(34) synthetase TilS [Dehalococcoidales bacterium]